ncbi:protease complex subunit PrcB family protein [Flavobacterium sp.]|uniref:protease complex subunit PrcB family protein n=1 Tax=Flavobacterium sp. TaxID=239 RepID=UPI00379FC028
MKKISILFLTLILFSCATSVKNSANKPLFEILTQQNDGGANIRFFEILTEPNEIKMLQNDAKLKNKISSNDIQTSNFIVLNMGEKATAGCKIGIESILETDKNIIITVKETSPKSHSTVSQVFTYPYCIVKVNSKKEIIIK